jgi:hypothetical protein
VVLATDQAVVALDCDHGVKGHRRALPEFDDVSGFRVWEVVPTPEPTRTFGTRVFGLSQGAAIPNLALVWPQRFTWHSDFQVRGWGRSRFGLAACRSRPLCVCERVCTCVLLDGMREGCYPLRVCSYRCGLGSPTTRRTSCMFCVSASLPRLTAPTRTRCT